MEPSASAGGDETKEADGIIRTVSGGARAPQETPPRSSSQQIVLPGLMVSMPSAGLERQSRTNTQFVSYDVVVQVDGHRWIVHRRYTDFRALADGIAGAKRKLPKLPGRSWFGNFDDAVIEARRADLEAYLQGVVEDDDARAQTATLEFLGAQTLQLGSLDSFPYAMRSGRFSQPVFANTFSPGRPSERRDGDQPCMRCAIA